MATYTKESFEWMQVGSRRSADIIVPMLYELLKPESVLDVGCGTGDWLKAFRDHGTREVFGIDGPWVSRELLKIKQEEFLAHDIKEPFDLEKRFDLVMTLEAIHHVPEEKVAEAVLTLTKHAPVVLFSAPIPDQQGSGTAVNEQWPEYWMKLFADQGYETVDSIRDQIWNNPDIEWWYAQNMFLFVEKNYLKSHQKLLSLSEQTKNNISSRVHPRLHLDNYYQGASRYSTKALLKAFPGSFMRDIKRKLKINNVMEE